jgi:hypothetical protein
MRCYFHLVNSQEEILDEEGIEVSDLETMECFALQALHEIRGEAIQLGASWQGWRLEVVDQAGSVLLTIPLEPTLQ